MAVSTMKEEILLIRDQPPSNGLGGSWAELCQQLYSDIRQQEKDFGFQKPKGALQKLFLQGFNHDQVWEQVALNDQELLQLTDDDLIAADFNTDNLCLQTSQLCIFAEQDLSQLQILKDSNLEMLSSESAPDQHASGMNGQLDESEEEGDDSEDGSDDGEDGSGESDLEETAVGDEEESDVEEGIELDGDECSDDDGDDNRDVDSIDEGLAQTEEDESENSNVDESDEGEGSDDEENEASDDEENEGSDDEEEMKSVDGEGEEGDEDQMNDGDNSSSDESDDSAYDELDKQLYEKYMKESDDEDGDSDEDDSGEEDLAVGTDEDSDEEGLLKLGDDDGENDESDDDEQEEDDSDDEMPLKKRNKIDKKSLSKTNAFKNLELPEFSKTAVDSKFLNLRESEWVADKDLIGQNNFDDIDFMEDIADDDDEGADVKYEDFFDEPPQGPLNNKQKKKNKSIPDNENQNEAENWLGDDEEFEEDEDMEVNNTSHPENDVDKVKSTLQEQMEQEIHLRKHLEEKNISDKPWSLKGEVKASERPTNSTLSEYLEFRSGAKLRPEINDALMRQLEKKATQRFRTKTFDSVERKAKLVQNPFEYKKKLVLDEEKSKKSLSQIYEEEYLRKQRVDKAKEENMELPEHKKVREGYTELAELLDALSNAHYTPKQAVADLKVVSNLPAISMEEATPIAVTDADMLAPQEILEPVRGELKGSTEKTDTDRKRERRHKKKIQHHKYKEINKRLDAKVKKAGKEGKKLDVDTSVKIVKKGLKVGHVKLLDTDGQSTKSSTAFFKNLSETHSAESKKRKRGSTK